MGKGIIMQNRLQISGVDLGKYIMAYCVVAIHFRPNYNTAWSYPSIIEWFIRLAVPFFFITSGYLFQRRIASTSRDESRRIALNRAKNIFRIWSYWLIISLPMAIYSYRDYSFIAGIKEYVYILIVYGWAPHAAPLWYLYSMMWVFLIVSLVVKFKHYKLWLLALFFSITIANWYAETTNQANLIIFRNYTMNTLGGGIYLIIGMQLYEFRRFFTTFQPKFIGGGILLIIMLLSILIYYFKFPCWTILGGAALFLFALKLPLRPSETLIGLRYQSMWIYYTHEYILFIVFHALAIKTHLDNPWIDMIIVFAVCAIEARALSYLQTHGVKFLNKLIK